MPLILSSGTGGEECDQTPLATKAAAQTGQAQPEGACGSCLGWRPAMAGLVKLNQSHSGQAHPEGDRESCLGCRSTVRQRVQMTATQALMPASNS